MTEFRPLLLLPLLLFFLSACGWTTPPPASRLWQEAVAHNERGIREQAQGNPEAALAEFAEALRLHSSIENERGKIVALVNMARIYRLQGDLEAAQQSAAQAAPLLQARPELTAEVRFEQARCPCRRRS